MSTTVLIVYRSRYGYTARRARELADRIGPDTHLVDLKDRHRIDLSPYRTVLIGGSVYGGIIQREVTAFCRAHRRELLDRRVGLFLCCLYEGERAEAQMADSFPPWLLVHAFGRYHLGGELDMDRLGVLDRLLVRVVLGQREGRRVPGDAGLEALAAEAREETR